MVALGVGLDPVAYLTAPPLLRLTLEEVMKQAEEAQYKRKEAKIKAIGAAVGQAIGQLFRKK